MAQTLSPLTASIPDDLKGYVAVITPGQAGFDTLLATLLSPQAMTDLTSAIPYVAILQNISKTPLRGVGVAFIQQPASGIARADRYSTVNTVSPQLWNAGDSKLYVPHIGLYHTLQPGASGQGIQLPAVPGLTVSSIAAALSAYSSITVSVSYVVTEKGKLIGPDPSNDFLALQAQQQARRDLTAKVRSHGVDKAGLIADLQATVQSRSNSVEPGRDHYSSELRAKARFLLNNILQGRSDSTYVADFLARTDGEIELSK